MALSIKTDEADRLARELAEATHETLTQAVTTRAAWTTRPRPEQAAQRVRGTV